MYKILVIEEDQSYRNILGEWLEDHGFEVIKGASGEACLQLAQQHNPDLIICNIVMPGMNGYEVLNHLRRDPETAHIPFIFLSDETRRVRISHMEREGVNTYLAKSIQPTELLKVITAQIKKRSNNSTN